VLVPSYNHAKFLPQCIESVLNQTFRDFELVIVDDGSKDDSLVIAQSYKNRFPGLIRVMTHEGALNMGISRTINRAVDSAKGDYICLLASDDWLPLDSLDHRVRCLNSKPDCGWIHGRATAYHEETMTFDECGHHDLSQDSDPYMTFSHRNPILAATVLAKRSVFIETGDHDATLVYSDWDYWARMLQISKPTFCKEPSVFYRHHSHNISLNIPISKAAHNELAVLQKFAKSSATDLSCFSSCEIKNRIHFEMGVRLHFIGDHKTARYVWGELLKISSDYCVSLATLKTWILPHLRTITSLSDDSLLGFVSNFCDALKCPKKTTSLLKWAHQQSRRLEAIRVIKTSYKNCNFSQARQLTISTAFKDPSIFLDPTCRKVLIYGLFAQFLKKPNAANVSGILPN
jgi:alpha-1,3-rhamnosyltransferase